MMWDKAKGVVDRVFTTSSKTTLLVTIGAVAWISEAPIPAIEQTKYMAAVVIAFILGQKMKESFARNGKDAEGG